MKPRSKRVQWPKATQERLKSEKAMHRRYRENLLALIRNTPKDLLKL